MADASPSQPFVRPYNPATDDEAVEYIFRQTADPSLRYEPAWTIGYHIWALPYIKLTPSTCFVLDPANGSQPVGYIIGTKNTSAFANDWANTYIPSLDPSILPPPMPNAPPPDPKVDLPGSLIHQVYHPESLLHPRFHSMVDEYPGHLHIDILPEYQGKSYGQTLMRTFLEALGEEGCEGVWLGMAGNNTRAESFYRKVGFERWREIMDGGKSGERGREGESPGTVYMVRSTERKE